MGLDGRGAGVAQGSDNRQESRAAIRAMTVRWSDRALRDVAGIFDYIAADNEDAALRVSDRIFEAANQLAVMPRLGRSSQFRRRRELIVDPYIIWYSIHRNEVLIHSVRHGARRN